MSFADPEAETHLSQRRRQMPVPVLRFDKLGVGVLETKLSDLLGTEPGFGFSVSVPGNGRTPARIR